MTYVSCFHLDLPQSMKYSAPLKTGNILQFFKAPFELTTCSVFPIHPHPTSFTPGISSHIIMSSNGSSSNRQDLVQNAILFLNDPKVQSSTLASKISFLETKGLNEAEIQEALARAPKEVTSGESSFARRSPYDTAAYGPPRYGYEYGVVPPPPRRDWRDIFVSCNPLPSVQESDGMIDYGCHLWWRSIWPDGSCKSAYLCGAPWTETDWVL